MVSIQKFKLKLYQQNEDKNTALWLAACEMTHPVHYDWPVQKVHDAVVPFSFGFELEKERFLKYLQN